MSKKAVALFALMTILSTSMSGCIGIPCDWTNSCEEMECGTIEIDGNWTGLPMPSFLGVDQNEQSWNLTSMQGEVWIAYFSAPWCAHCESTLDAYDQVIPEGKLLIFNKDIREEHSNMSEWKETSEEKIGRNISRPFMNAPGLSDVLGVEGIPHAFVVDENGVIVDFTLGAHTDPVELDELYSFYANSTISE
ncbi:MAG: redoxin domain-containing protein [Euryarchaeota archaeon]|jgi:thiol-disulfide isomerase/thioredoxin|nr:redoxin domain-containing protein [Euryarchaeota archaeon]